MRARLALVFVALKMLAICAGAHPVAQGAMEIVVHADRLEMRARVSNEEAFVAEAFGVQADAGATLEDVRRRHGEYLLAHFHLTADGAPLAGKITRITPPEKSAPGSLIGYDLEFLFSDARQRPGAIELRQDVLNEFSFAPGNRWEASYVVRISQAGHAAEAGLLFTSREPLHFACDWSAPAATAGSARVDQRAMALAFVRHGIAHILSGYDHLLFVSGLVLAVGSLWDLAKVVTAFTVAHTLTLTLAVLDLVRLPSAIVEPMIAASIVFVALQNIVAPRRSRGWTRLAVAFGFGLFHGLGFAGGLLEAMHGMAGVAILTAIAAFSLGVEIGHQCVALPLFAALKIVRQTSRLAADPESIPRWTLRLGSGAICAAGFVYFVAALRTPGS